MARLSILSFLSIIAWSFLTEPQCVEAKNILVYGAVGSHSIRLSMWPMMEQLSNNGHNVTFLSALENFEDTKKKSKVTSYTPTKLKEAMSSWGEYFDFYAGRQNKYGVPFAWMQARVQGIISCEALYSDPDFVNFVETSHFDLVIVEMLVNECAFGLARKWNSKLIMYSTTSVVPWFPDAHGLPDESSSISDLIFGFPSGEKMSFLQRFVNTLNPVLFTVTREWTYLPQLEEITRKGLGLTTAEHEQLPSFREVEKNTSLVLLTTHFSLDFPRSLPPYAIPVGGSVVTKQKKPIPKEMEDFINSGNQGFIYVSFGTFADFTLFPKQIQLNFINALSNFPETKFIWKSHNDITVTQLPKNVFMTKWAPQQTLLTHPKIKAFLTHGGMGSITEGVHFSVPLICIPVLAEQDFNSLAITEKGAAVMLEIVDLTQEQVEHAISEILNNPKYRNKMKKVTEIFKDRPTPPLENAVWWIEYILRHDDTNEFLRPPSVNLPWWKRRNVDIWVTATLIFVSIPLLTLVILYKLVAAIFSSKKIKPSSQSSQDQKKRPKYD